jgi:hypothetical protein
MNPEHRAGSNPRAFARLVVVHTEHSSAEPPKGPARVSRVVADTAYTAWAHHSSGEVPHIRPTQPLRLRPHVRHGRWTRPNRAVVSNPPVQVGRNQVVAARGRPFDRAASAVVSRPPLRLKRRPRVSNRARQLRLLVRAVQT